MAAQKVEKKRKRNRKARTEDSESDSPQPTKEPQQKSPTTQPAGQDDVLNAPAESESSSSPSPPAQQILSPEQAFSAFYLKQATREFANDLDKLRSAADFRGESSVGILIEALRQGEACFGTEERRRIGESSAGE